ncbi:3952_t:CDS:2, partial [Gigaspora margarita]
MHITEGYVLSKIEPGYRSQSGSKYSKIKSTPNENKLLEASLEVGNLIVYVTSLEIESNINMMEASIRYISSFIGEFKKKHALFVQAIEKDNCKITIYISENESIIVLGKTPDDAWKNI